MESPYGAELSVLDISPSATAMSEVRSGTPEEPPPTYNSLSHSPQSRTHVSPAQDVSLGTRHSFGPQHVSPNLLGQPTTDKAETPSTRPQSSQSEYSQSEAESEHSTGTPRYMLLTQPFDPRDIPRPATAGSDQADNHPGGPLLENLKETPHVVEKPPRYEHTLVYPSDDNDNPMSMRYVLPHSRNTSSPVQNFFQDAGLPTESGTSQSLSPFGEQVSSLELLQHPETDEEQRHLEERALRELDLEHEVEEQRHLEEKALRELDLEIPDEEDNMLKPGVSYSKTKLSLF